MSRFQIGDVIRHRTGVNLFHVCPHNMVKDMYLVKPDGAEAGVFKPLACSYVDENFTLFERRIQDGVATEDASHALKLQQEFMSGMMVDMETGFVPNYLLSMPRGAGKRSVMEKVAEFARGYGTDLNASAQKGRWIGAVPPVKIDLDADVPEDVAVTLEGIPQGYYLKAFRVAGPADLIIKTKGSICEEDVQRYYKGEKRLLRPIIAKIPAAKPAVPGIPAGYELVRVGSPHPGDLAIGYEGGVEECFIHIVNKNRPIVRKKVYLTPCTGVLPGIPLGYKVVRFGDVSPEEFYFDTAGNLKQGPSKHRLVVEKREVPLAFSGHAEIPRTSVDWGVVDRKVRQDAVDAAAYAAEHLKRQCEDTAFTEREFMNVKSRTTVWTTASDIMMQGTEFIPTGLTRKVKVS